MSLTPNPTERIARARADLRMGVPVVIADRKSALVFAVETLNERRWRHALRLLEDPVMTITDWRAHTLRARVYDGDLARVDIPKDASIEWLQSLADPAYDLSSPMKGPLKTKRGGDTVLHRAALKLVKSAHLLPAAIVIPIPNAWTFSSTNDLTVMELDSLQSDDQAPTMHQVVQASLPLEVSDAGRLHVFRPDDGGEEHYAIEIGQPDRSKPVLSRLHSACLTGDLLGSLKCDCGPQLRAGLRHIGDEGSGVLLYLNQEGRGIGLANKMRAYSLQDQGFDTVEANHRLGFEDDERDFRIGSTILKSMGFSSVRLMTNNPAKVARMEENGIKVVDRVPLKVGKNHHNAHYLDIKAKKSGHIL
ncbi:GTP cyclohydrolase II [Parasulfitobacter algicola]|uniref:GTP cyclohydrolase-2 n=1 Tax=Parasulfitobacter algicola TaxID=2614809 RepID=A0ABX2ILQ4_9RHOB|nr:GTP cyclohydrolase II [Sulfitobacter algicola]NSX53804.1 GTP cyclohydrolase II [Sulfitobacter algicola]